MADIDFTVTDGPYAGRYQIDFADLTGRDSADFRRALGIPLSQVMQQKSADVDALAALVWLTRRRMNRALPFEAVADAITYGNVQETPSDAPAEEADPTDPLSSGDASSR